MVNLRYLFIAVLLGLVLVLAQTPDPSDAPVATIADPVVTDSGPIPTVNPRDTEQAPSDGGSDVAPTDSGSGSDESGSDQSGSGETGSDGGSQDTGSSDQPVDTAPADTAPAETAPADTAPADTAPTETAPAETAPAETAPAETKPSDPEETGSSDPVETNTGGDESTPTDAESEPSETKGLLPPSQTDAEEPASTDAEAPSPTSNDEPSETESDGPSNTDSEESSPADSNVPTETGDNSDSPTATEDSPKATKTDKDSAKSTDGSDEDSSKTDSDSPTSAGDDEPTATSDENASETTDSKSDDNNDDTSTKSGDDATGSETASSPSSPTNTEEVDTGIVAVGPSDGAESTQETPDDITTPEQHESESTANLPSTVISGTEAEEIVVMEAIMFDHFANNDPAPGDSSVIEIASNVSSCKVGVQKRDTWGNRAIKRRDLRTDCKYVTSLEFDVNFNYIRGSADGERPNQLQDRIKKGMELLNDAYGGLGVTFNYKNYQQYAPPSSGDNKDWSKVKQFSDKLQNFQSQTRSGDEMTLNVWLVNDLESADGNPLNAYSAYPWDKKGLMDGIVMRQDRINKNSVPTLIHEVGHWLGLRHTFREQVAEAAQDCKAADTLIKSSITTGLKSSMYQCKQATCSDSKEKDILNFMSYSQCRGQITKNGFTTDQKSSIFSRVLKYRRGFRDGECTPTYTTSTVGKKMAKRSTMQDLIDGVCPNVAAGVQDLESQPTNTNQGATLGFSLVPVAVAVAASMFFMI